MRKLAFFIFLLFSSPLLHGIDESVTLMTDGRSWIPIDIILPYGQQDVWLMPEDGSLKRKEFIIVKEEAADIQLKNLSPVLVDPKGSKELFKEKTSNSNLLAFISTNDRFVANLSLQGKKRVHHIRYVAPASSLSKEEQILWVNRLKQSAVIDEDSNKKNLSNIIVKSDGVYKQSKKLQPNSTWNTYTHPRLNFAIEFPATWGFIDDSRKKSPINTDPGLYTHVVFNRLDKLASGLVARIQTEGQKSQQENDQDWQDSLDLISQDNTHLIVGHGEIQNKQGKTGKYLVLKDVASKEKSFKALFQSGDKTYKIECTCHEDNFDLMYPYFHRILQSFTLPKG